MSKSYLATWEYDGERLQVTFDSAATESDTLRDTAALTLLATDPSKAAVVVAIMQVADLKIEQLVK
jgi:hypothetical protein